MQAIRFAAVGWGVVVFVLLATSCGGIQWMKAERWLGTAFEKQYGLWRSCVGDVCVKIDPDTLVDWEKAVQAFSLLSVLATAAGIVTSLLFVFDKIPYLVPGAAFIGAAICSLIAMAVYTSETQVLVNNYNRLGDFKYGWSFILGWIGMILAGINGLLVIVINLKSRSE